MAVFEWGRRRTKHFGEVQFAVAHVRIKSADGRYQAFALQVDSGAVVSLLRRSAADMLGVPLNSGARIDMSSVGGAQVHAYVHELIVKLDNNWPPMTTPFAIAESERVPNLLGWRGVFDRFRIEFEPRPGTTMIEIV